MDKIVISPQEVTEIKPPLPDQAPRLEPKLPPAIALWTRLVLSLLVVVLPVLCLVTIILRVALRGQPPRIRHAWTAYLSTLLIISGFLTCMAGVAFFSVGPSPATMSMGLSELDERTEYPSLPSSATLSGSDAAQQLKPLVAVISPAAETFFGKREALSNEFGAGVLLQSTPAGFLFATARHVVGSFDAKKHSRALISMASGVWSGADVIARHTSLDLVLIWLPRQFGKSEFVQPITAGKEGSTIFVIGHPEGLKFTLSTGIVSRRDGSMLQISAPVSPGNSGGPVYDQQGNLVAIVNSTMDKTLRPNAENLNFAVSAAALEKVDGWDFADGGKEHLQDFLKASSSAKAVTTNPAAEKPAAKPETAKPETAKASQ